MTAPRDETAEEVQDAIARCRLYMADPTDGGTLRLALAYNRLRSQLADATARLVALRKAAVDAINAVDHPEMGRLFAAVVDSGQPIPEPPTSQNAAF